MVAHQWGSSHTHFVVHHHEGVQRGGSGGIAPAVLSPPVKWARRVLANWLRVRKKQGLAGDFLFPATRTGRQWGKVTRYEGRSYFLCILVRLPGENPWRDDHLRALDFPLGAPMASGRSA